MATWHDLPLEVKEMIFRLVCTNKTIVYSPKDRRLAHDDLYHQHRRFHDLLIVSKDFITADEFSSAILLTAQVKLRSTNDLLRLCKEVSHSFTSCIRNICLERQSKGGVRLALLRDSFEGFSAMRKTLSTHMPNLKQIFISWTGYCANIGHHSPRTNRTPPTDEEHANMLKYTLTHAGSEKPIAKPADLVVGVPNQSHSNSLPYIAASFLSDRKSQRQQYAWTRPLPALRRLLLYAEDNNIEIILQTQLCITNSSLERFELYGSQGTKLSPDKCWSNEKHHLPAIIPYFSLSPYQIAPSNWNWIMHTPVSMSTRDWMLRCEVAGEQYAFHQKLAYDMIHAPAGKAFVRCKTQMEELRYAKDAESAFGLF